MNTNLKHLIALVIGFAIGLGAMSYFSKGDTTTIDSKTDTTTKRKTIKVKEPNGKETTTIVEDIKKSKDVVATKTEAKKPKNNISALVGVRFDRGDVTPAYGVNFTREFIGPVTLGVWGLTDGTAGVSLGVNF